MTKASDVYWLEQTEADVPEGNHWLSAREALRLGSLRFTKRRTDWRLGRWTAKRAVAACLNLPETALALRDIAIHAGPSGAPEVFLFNEKTVVNLSISHSVGKAFCVVGLSGARVGCDLELVESRDGCFVADFFTENEQKLIFQGPANQRPLLATLMWSAKESALKAMNVGLRLSTTLLEVNLQDRQESRVCSAQGDYVLWSPLVVRYADQMIHGCWRNANNMVRTVVFSTTPFFDKSSFFPTASPKLFRAAWHATSAVAVSR